MEIIYKNYISGQLDKIDVLEVLTELRNASRKGLLGQSISEQNYRQRVIQTLTVDEFISERKRVYGNYDSYCDNLVPLLMKLDTLNPSERILAGADAMWELFLLDGERREIGGVYNDPNSIGRKAEQDLKDAMSLARVDQQTQDVLFRTILLPKLPYDVEFQKDMWSFIAGSKDYSLKEYIFENGKELAEKHTRGSIHTLFRKIQPLIKNRSSAKQMYDRIERAYQLNLGQKSKVMGLLEQGGYEEFRGLLESYSTLARFNCIEDLQRRTCIDRFEEYLLRKNMVEALHALKFIDQNDLFSISQGKLCKLAKEVKNGIC